MSLLGFSAHTLPLLKIMLNSLSLLLILLQLATLSSAQPTFVKYLCDNTYGNYTTNSTYQQNLNTLLSNISSNTHITYGFYNFSSGNDPNTVNGLAYCRGDVLLDDCRSCIKNATAEISSLCTNQKQAIGWYDDCMIRYTNRSIFGVMEVTPWYSISNRYKALNQSDFSSKLDGLFMSLVSTAAAGNSTLKFAIGKAYVSTFITIYSYTQCTPDLSQSDCYNCLSETISSLHVCCIPYQGARIYTPSCHIRYETYGISNVFDVPASEAPSPSSLSPTLAVSTPPTPGRGKGSTTSKVVVVVVVITVGIAVVCLLLVGIFYFCVRKDKRKWKKANNESEQEDDITTSETLLFAYAEIKDATQDFAEANKLGRGGFGTVYKGVLANGREIAVKRLSRNSNQGEGEFMTEVQLLAKLQHRNLVKLLGFSFAGEERLLIYEFMPNASLDHILFGKSNHVSLDWKTRYNIIGGIARGLVYLHEDSRVRIIHRDLKASNILLDAHLNPKIADFGMARLFQADQTHANTQRIAGTYGYMAPEYAKRGMFSVKSDVYSFGILVLEIICGQKNSSILQNENMEGLVASVWRNWREGTACDVVDSALVTASRVEIMRCIQIGLLCVQADPADRPTMSSVNLMLSSGSFSMALPSQPAYVQQRSLAVDQQKEYVTEEESITDLYPR